MKRPVQGCESLSSLDNDAPKAKKARYVSEPVTHPLKEEEEKYSSRLVFVNPIKYYPDNNDLRLPIHEGMRSSQPHHNDYQQLTNRLLKKVSKNGH